MVATPMPGYYLATCDGGLEHVLGAEINEIFPKSQPTIRRGQVGKSKQFGHRLVSEEEFSCAL